MRSFFASLFVGGCMLLVGAGCAASPLALTPTPDVSSSGAISDASTQPSMQWTFQGKLPDDRILGKIARISTKYGDIVIRLFPDTAPIAVSNFVYLAEGGYYNNLTFHRRVEGFVIQGGDPSGDGTGGPGYAFDDEVADDHTYTRGIVAMANAGVRNGKGTNGSQFFIMLADNPLPKAYSIFGEVLEGMDVVDQIRVGDVMTTVSIEADTQN